MPLVTKKEEQDPLIAQVVEQIVVAFHINQTIARAPDQYGSVALNAMANACADTLHAALRNLGYSKERIATLLKHHRRDQEKLYGRGCDSPWPKGGGDLCDHPANVRYLRAKLLKVSPDDLGRELTPFEQVRAHMARARTGPPNTLPPEAKPPSTASQGPALALPRAQARHRVRPPARPAVGR